MLSCTFDVVRYSKSARAKFEVRRSSIHVVSVRSVVVRRDVEIEISMVRLREEVISKPK